MTKRIYEFELPYMLPGMFAGRAVSEIQSMGLWARVPKKLQKKLSEASWWSPVEITKADLDGIPDDLWKKLAERLNLKWRKA
jgi:hypothetical protein